jgi:guanylate kinase
MKDKIVCLVGESGSGKSTIAELLEKKGCNYIQSYTTRKPRFEGEKGHIFVDRKQIIDKYNIAYDSSKMAKDKAISMALIDNSIAYTYYNGEHYYAVEEQYQDKGISIYVIDVAGIKMLREKVKDAEILVIYIKTDEMIRTQRMYYRKHPDENSIFIVDADIQQRIKHDKESFKIIPCDYVVDANRKLEEVLMNVRKIINA